MEKVKEVPYGVADFVTVMEQNLYYVDKTMFIPELEKQPRNLFFIRPRRFGKSTFLSMLHSYYDCNQSAKFQSLFGNLWIGQHPTELQGKYQVLFLDFSQVSGNIDSLERNFDFYCSVKLDGFMRRYGEAYSEETREKVRKAEYAMDKLAFIHDEAAQKGFDAIRKNFLTVMVTGERTNWSDKSKRQFGTDDCFVRIDKAYVF